jgi:glycosyltransferase involved in cell wall biosynthesis
MDQEIDVGIITTIHPPFDGRIYERTLAALIDSGLSVCLISPWKKPDRPWLAHEWVIISAPRKRLGRIRTDFQAFSAARKLPARAYYFHDLDFLPWAVALKYLKGRPVVYDCHENYPEEIRSNKGWIPPFLRPPISLLIRRLEDWAVKKLGVSVVVVPHQVERFSKLGVRTVLVQNYPQWEPHPDLQHERALIYSGSISPAYGAAVLLGIGRELEKRNLDFPLIIVDRFSSGDLKAEFETAIRNENIPIIIRPPVKARDMDILLRQACLGLSTDQDSAEKRLARPTKIFEYMAMGLPVIASSLPNARDIIATAGCGVTVAPHLASEYVDAAVSLLEDPGRFRRFQENGFRAVATRYHWRFEQPKLSGLFKELVTGAPAAARKRG